MVRINAMTLFVFIFLRAERCGTAICDETIRTRASLTSIVVAFVTH